MTSEAMTPKGVATARGTLFVIVGPSGVGKDTLIDGARAALGQSHWFRFVRRVITRPADSGGEEHIAISEADFDAALAEGRFFHHWRAHGLGYGVPADVAGDLAAGINVVLNGSRAEVAALREKYPRTVTIQVTASRAAVEARLRARGREDEAQIAKRLDRLSATGLVEGALELRNEGPVADGVAALVDLIAGSCDLCATAQGLDMDFAMGAVCLAHRDNPVAARLLAGSTRVAVSHEGAEVVADLGWTSDSNLVGRDALALSSAAMEKLGLAGGECLRIARSPTPQSREVLQRKIRGGTLSAPEITGFVDDLVNGRFSPPEVAGFLVTASTNLALDEIIALTKARASHARRQRWAADVVVDKHSMGGIPGNRITPIVIPIVAAHGLTMPKTSSRAITSAAGTADMMEVMARVDLGPEEFRKVVEATGGAICWNGRLTHSPVDDVMNAINRPLGLSSALLDVSSILSKKLAAGSSHVLIDLPLGPQAKTRTEEEAAHLKSLFESVGEGVGLSVRVNIADGSRPIGRGVGPLLEVIDVLDVLRSDPDAPEDLAEKAVDYAAQILEWAGGVEAGQGTARARALIASGAALAKLEEIAQHQGAHEYARSPGSFTALVTAPEAGRVASADIRTIASVARRAGAPRDKAAGVVVLVQVGVQVDKGQPLLRIHASSGQALAAAQEVLAGGAMPFAISP